MPGHDQLTAEPASAGRGAGRPARLAGVAEAKEVVVAAPRGYCAGVDRAVVTVESALEIYGPPVYVRKQIVHNRHVVEDLEQRARSS